MFFRRVVSLVACGLTSGTLALGSQAAVERERAKYWPIAADDYLQDGDPTFPEAALLPADRDVGIAFAGGGTRSASMTAGELRGLEVSGLMRRVRYVSAVSGGSWASIAWTYSGQPGLLGRYQGPDELGLADVRATPNGTLAGAVKGVSLALSASEEVGLGFWAANVEADSRDLVNLVRRVLGAAPSPDRTYTTLLADNLIGRLVPAASSAGFVWNDAQRAEIQALNPGLPQRSTVSPLPGRPFLIVNAHVVNAGADFAYPMAIPFEFTPLYVGARQRVGGLFGGMYAWPSAYNPATARVVRDVPNVIEVTHDAAHPPITLADVAASSGAAPLFWVVGGNGLKVDIRELIRRQGGMYFPTFTHLALRDEDVIVPTTAWPHADGGARDNLGITALLARHVKKIVVFVNVNSPDFTNNSDIRSLFLPGVATPSSDKSGNVVFKDGAAAHTRLIAAFNNARRAGRPLVACDDYDVVPNRIFNIRAYDDVHVCWAYPDRVASWTEQLEAPLRALVENRCTSCGDLGSFENFPWIATFAQNRDIRHPTNVGLLNLTDAQVNLLGDLMAWTVVESKSLIESAFQTR